MPFIPVSGMVLIGVRKVDVKMQAERGCGNMWGAGLIEAWRIGTSGFSDVIEAYFTSVRVF